MRFDKRFLIVALVSLLWGFLVAGFFHRIAAGSGTRVRKTPGKSVVVAARVLPLGSTVTRDAVKLRDFPEKLFPAGGTTRVEDVLNRPVISPIQAEEPVVEARLAPRGSGMGLAPLIPTGMRAIAVRVNDVVGVAGFVLPGMHVDVLVTARPPGRTDSFTRTVLQNITVLSAGRSIETDGKDTSMNVPVVTLLVKPEEAEAMTLAYAEGHIQLVLRNSTDERVAATRGRALQQLLDPPPETASQPEPKPVRRAALPAPAEPAAGAAPALATPAPVAMPAPPPAPAAPLVTIIRGNARILEPEVLKSREAK